MSESYLEIQLDQQPIELCKLLKIADLVTGGGEAKVAISEGYVLLNGDVEYQKRKKIYHNDIVEFNGEVIQVVINEDLTESLTSSHTENSNEQPLLQSVQAQEFVPSKNSTQPKSNNKNSSKNTNTQKTLPTDEGTARANKRKPISF